MAVLSRSRVVRNENTGRIPEDPDQSAEVQILISSAQFHWLTTQCEFLRLTKQELIADILEEWLRRNSALKISKIDPSIMVGWALDEFMRSHRDEFLPVDC
jgi:hypothetical protein